MQIQVIKIKLTDRMPCPSRMSALEQSISKYAEEPTKSVIRPEVACKHARLW